MNLETYSTTTEIEDRKIRPRKSDFKKGGKPVLSDDVILAIRALREFAQWPHKRIAEYYKMDRKAVYGIIDHINRVHLIPKREHLPEGVEAKI